MSEDGLDRAAVLALEPIDRLELLLHLAEATRLPVDRLPIRAQLAGCVAELDAQASDPLGEAIKIGVDALYPCAAPPPCSESPVREMRDSPDASRSPSA